MPQRARDRSSLNTSHELLHYRDDRALSVARQQLEHPKDRRRSKGHGGCSCGWCSGHMRDPLGEYRRSRGGRPLSLDTDDIRSHPADTDAGRAVAWEEKEKRHPGSSKVDLWEIAQPGRVRRDIPKGYELVPRPKEVLVLDGEGEESDEDFELVELPQMGKKGRKGRSFAQAVKGRRRER